MCVGVPKQVCVCVEVCVITDREGGGEEGGGEGGA